MNLEKKEKESFYKFQGNPDEEVQTFLDFRNHFEEGIKFVSSASFCFFLESELSIL